jgi:hypothetical protein
VPSAEVALLHMSEVVRSVASPVVEEEESLGLVPPRRAL